MCPNRGGGASGGRWVGGRGGGGCGGSGGGGGGGGGGGTVHWAVGGVTVGANACPKSGQLSRGQRAVQPWGGGWLLPLSTESYFTQQKHASLLLSGPLRKKSRPADSAGHASRIAIRATADAHQSWSRTPHFERRCRSGAPMRGKSEKSRQVTDGPVVPNAGHTRRAPTVCVDRRRFILELGTLGVSW